MSSRLLREPLVHFLLLGAALFGLHAVMQGVTGNENARVVVTKGRLATLRETFRAKNGRPPTPDEMSALVDAWVRTEILCREELKKGFDHNDHVLRERLADKAQFRLETSLNVPSPTQAELEQYLAAHPERFRSQGASGVPALASVKSAVLGAWLAERRKEAEAAAYDKLRQGYVVVVEKDGDAP